MHHERKKNRKALQLMRSSQHLQQSLPLATPQLSTTPPLPPAFLGQSFPPPPPPPFALPTPPWASGGDAAASTATGGRPLGEGTVSELAEILVHDSPLGGRVDSTAAWVRGLSQSGSDGGHSDFSGGGAYEAVVDGSGGPIGEAVEGNGELGGSCHPTGEWLGRFGSGFRSRSQSPFMLCMYAAAQWDCIVIKLLPILFKMCRFFAWYLLSGNDEDSDFGSEYGEEYYPPGMESNLPYVVEAFLDIRGGLGSPSLPTLSTPHASYRLPPAGRKSVRGSLAVVGGVQRGRQ